MNEDLLDHTTRCDQLACTHRYRVALLLGIDRAKQNSPSPPSRHSVVSHVLSEAFYVTLTFVAGDSCEQSHLAAVLRQEWLRQV